MQIDFISKLVLGEIPTKIEIANALYDICDRVHGSCDSDCPVYVANGNKVPFDNDGDCPYHKSGHKMFDFLQKNIPELEQKINSVKETQLITKLQQSAQLALELQLFTLHQVIHKCINEAGWTIANKREKQQNESNREN